MFGKGTYLDAQGSPTSTWSINHGSDGNGRPTASISKNTSRDIKIFGKGDIMFMAGSEPSTIRFVEVDLQPKLELGHYPIHFHRAGTSVSGTLIEGVVVKNSTQRCIVPHGSTGITIRDTICTNIADDAIWWDPPTESKIDDQYDSADNSHRIKIEHVLVDGVSPRPGDSGFRVFGFLLGAGTNNSIRNSVARGIEGTSHSGGYYWPSQANLIPNHWDFENNTTIDAHACAYTWQNGLPVGGAVHHLDGLTCIDTRVMGIGAYSMVQRWEDVRGATQTDVWSVRSEFISADLGKLTFRKPPKIGPITITDSWITEILISHGISNPTGEQHITITNSGVTCADVTVEIAGKGTTLTIDGVECDLR